MRRVWQQSRAPPLTIDTSITENFADLQGLDLSTPEGEWPQGSDEFLLHQYLVPDSAKADEEEEEQDTGGRFTCLHTVEVGLWGHPGFIQVDELLAGHPRLPNPMGSWEDLHSDLGHPSTDRGKVGQRHQ